MSEKRKYILNCDICDTRKMVEANYADYETIVINCDILVQNEESKAIMSRLPVELNADQVIELEGDEAIHKELSNGHYEITSNTHVGKNTVLLVNGNLTIAAGCEDVLKNYISISVNGSVRYPENLNAVLPPLAVNGKKVCYPEGAVVLKDRFKPDKYFSMRAKEGNKYFAEKVVFLTDLEVNVRELKEKNIQFVTPRCVIAEELVEDAIALIDEQVEMHVVPSGFVAITENAELNRGLLEQNGVKMDVLANLTIQDEGIEELRTRMERGEEVDIRVEGDLQVVHRLASQVETLPITYAKLKEVKGYSVAGQGVANVNRKTLELYPDGIIYKGIGAVNIDKDISPEGIVTLLEFKGVGMIRCSKEQESAVNTVSSGVGSVVTGIVADKELSGNGTDGSLLGLLKKGFGMIKDTKLVNADDFVM